MANEDLKRLSKNMKELVKSTEKEVLTELSNGLLNAVAEDLNRFQLQDGQRADGQFLPDYSQTSVEKFGKQPGPIKLKDTGEFYNEMSVELRNKKLTFTNYSRKLLHPPARLAQRYTLNILGLTTKNIKLFKDDYIIPFAADYVEKFLIK